MKNIYEQKEIKENALTVVVCSKKTDNKARKIDEIEKLSTTAGLIVVGNFYQNLKEFNRSTVIGSGKVEEIKQHICNCDAQIDVVVVDYPLTGSQVKNLEDAFGVKVIDRVGLIIDIFAQGAQSKEAKLQVKLAQDLYLLPRLSQMQGSSGRFGGVGVGMRGPGETKLELNRRILEKEIDSLKKQIQKIKSQRQVSRKERLHSSLPKIALVGYTNSGKSSLLNLLTKENIYVENKYFATLDTTSRKLFLGEGNYALLTDTVGFISDLPHQLVDAFSSTLEEATDADLLIHVVDVSLQKNEGDKKEYQTNMDITDKLLDEIGATKKRIVALNKCDKLEKPIEIKNNQILISTKTGNGIPKLIEAIRIMLNE